MTATNQPDREAWEKRIGGLSCLYHDWREADLGHGSAPPEADNLWDKYALEKSALVAAILALQSKATTLQAEGERLTHLEKQINDLANFIMAEIPGEPSQSEGAVDTAIRLLKARQSNV